MEAKAETQEKVRYLLNEIINFNKTKQREYQDVSFDIQRNYFIDDYVDLLSHMNKNYNTIADFETRIDELSEEDIIKVEQALRYTVDFIGLKINNHQAGTGYRAIEAYFPSFNALNPPNPFELLLYIIDPHGSHIRGLRNSFPMLSASEQMDYLHTKYNEGMKKSGRARGSAAVNLRNLRSQMKLDGLFNINNRFMNIELREFLNVNENGADSYTLQEVNVYPWREVISSGSALHQLTAPNTKVVFSYIYLTLRREWVPIYVYNRLNAKFCHPDGREAVFSYSNNNEGVFVNHIHDKGTYNYGNDRGNDIWLGITSIPPFPHYEYDIKRFIEYKNDLQNASDDFKMELYQLTEENGGQKFNLFPPNFGNSKFWEL